MFLDSMKPEPKYTEEIQEVIQLDKKPLELFQEPDQEPDQEPIQKPNQPYSILDLSFGCRLRLKYVRDGSIDMQSINLEKREVIFYQDILNILSTNKKTIKRNNQEYKIFINQGKPIINILYIQYLNFLGIVGSVWVVDDYYQLKEIILKDNYWIKYSDISNQVLFNLEETITPQELNSIKKESCIKCKCLCNFRKN